MSYPVLDIANKIIASTDAEQGEIISNLKLQKLLYYVQGFFIAVFDKRLFNENIEAWQYGPVVRNVYFHFKDFGFGAITLREGTEIIELEPEQETLFKNVLAEYGQFSAIKLMDMTHGELPWATVFPSSPQGEITDQLLKQYFLTEIEE